MIRRKKLMTFIGVIAGVCALATAGAGVATALGPGATPKAGLQISHHNRPLTKAAREQVDLLRHADFSTRAGIDRYLRAAGINPSHLVIQRGAKNYAGPRCPGKGWTCTKARRVLQIGTASVFYCTSSSCTTIQPTGGTATCFQVTSTNPVTQNCSITQNSVDNDNKALVVQVVTHFAGGPSATQAATQNASVTQSATGLGSNSVVATQNVIQSIGKGSGDTDENDNDDADDGMPSTTFSASQSQEGHESLTIVQNSKTGNNSALESQAQAQRERIDRAVTATQLQNTQDQLNNCPTGGFLTDPVANACTNVQQSSTGGGQNTSKLFQFYGEFQAASNVGGGQQAQGSLVSASNGGLDHSFTHASSGVSTQTSNQIERLIQRRLNTTGLAVSQHGPTRKGTGSQSGNTGDSATQAQNSFLLSTGPSASFNQTDVLTDVCSSAGNCTGTQDTNVNGQTTHNSAGPSGSIAIFIACGGASIFPGPPPTTTTTTTILAPVLAPPLAPTTCTSGPIGD